MRLLAPVLLLCLPLSAQAATWTVCTLGIGCDYANLEDAIQFSSPGDTIEIEPGDYLENGIDIDWDLTIRGMGPGVNVDLDQDIQVNALLLTLEDIDFRPASVGSNRRAIRWQSGGLMTVTGCLFDGFSTNGNGGAIRSDNGGDLFVYGSTFLNNASTSCCSTGGALYSSNGNLEVHDSVFSSNTAGFGGAVGAQDGSLLVANSVFDQNTAGNDGGAIGTQNADTEVRDSQFSANDAGQNGGAAALDGTVLFLRSDLCQNTAADDGGGIYFDNDGSSTGEFRNLRIWEGSADNGGAIYLGAWGPAGSTTARWWPTIRRARAAPCTPGSPRWT